MMSFETFEPPEHTPHRNPYGYGPGVSTPEIRAPIRVLPRQVAARIAAGEVVERPASVVKELVENALDAGATHIRVDVSGAGLTLIRVSDNGCGIPSDEMRLACERHATSKLSNANLSGVSTLGFRGEALPSIAAVSELTLVSAYEDANVGRKLILRECRIVGDEPAPRTRGTTATVRDLFRNVPVRLASGGQSRGETAQIGQTVRRLALSSPWCRVELFVDHRAALKTSGSGELTTVLAEVYSTSLVGRLITFGPANVAGTKVWGAIGGPEVTRPGRGQINFVVNGRWVQPRGLQSQIETFYRPLLPRGRHPVLAVLVEAPKEEVDINIHPSKLEVRMRNEREIGRAAGELIRDVLSKRPVQLQQPFATGLDALAPGMTLAEERSEWDEDSPIVTPGLPPLRLIGQAQARMLMLEGPEGLYLVDQHRAHERILYERLKTVGVGPGHEPRVLPEPLLIELRPAQVARFGQRLEDLASLGFDFEVFGGKTFLLRSAPALPGVLNDQSIPTEAGEAGEFVSTFLELSDEDAADGESWRENLLVRLACRVAIRRGKTLDLPTMRALVTQLGHTSAPAVCPHGSPLLMHVSRDLLERQFRWT